MRLPLEPLALVADEVGLEGVDALEGGAAVPAAQGQVGVGVVSVVIAVVLRPEWQVHSDAEHVHEGAQL